MKLKFNNKDEYNSDKYFFGQLQKNAVTTSTTMSMSKTKWDKSEENTSSIESIINSAIDVSKNKVLAGKNQDIQINRNGILCATRNDAGVLQPEQIRIINNCIAFSSDGFATASLALDSSGVYANILAGKSIIGITGSYEGIGIYDTINGVSKETISIGKPNIYSSSSTYLIGDTCTYGGLSYKCTSLISTPEAWTVGHWTLTSSGSIVINSYTALGAYKNRIQIDGDVGIKAQKYVNGAFVDQLYFDTNTGNLTLACDLNAAGGSFTGELAIGSGNNIFKAKDGSIWLGAIEYVDAPFKVSNTGVLTATGVNLTGYIDSAGSASYAGSASVAGTLTVGASITSPIITGNDGYFNSLFKVGNNPGIILDASQNSIRAGKTAWQTGTGFWMGYDNSAWKLDIGSDTNYLRWDGTNLDIAGRFGVHTVTTGEALTLGAYISGSKLYGQTTDGNRTYYELGTARTSLASSRGGVLRCSTYLDSDNTKDCYMDLTHNAILGYDKPFAIADNYKILLTDKTLTNAFFTNTYGSSVNIDGNISVGTNYILTAAPTNGAIIEGNVGIGTDSPSYLLHVNGTGAATLFTANTMSCYNLWLASTTQPVSPNAGQMYFDGTNLKIYINGSWQTII